MDYSVTNFCYKYLLSLKLRWIWIAFYGATRRLYETPELPVSPVDTDRREVKNRSRAAQDVEGDPRVAQRITQHPTRVVYLRHSNSNSNFIALNRLMNLFAC